MSGSETSNFICQLCGNKYSYLPNNHPEQHGMTMPEYKLLYGEDHDSYVQCKYFNADTQYQCELNKYSDFADNFCILHHPTEDKDHDLFNHVLEILIKTWMHYKKEFHFEGIFFPTAFIFAGRTVENDVFFRGSHFLKNADLSKVNFKSVADFRNCIFEGDASFKSTIFQKKAKFQQSIFLDTLSFQNAIFSSLIVIHKYSLSAQMA